MEKRSKSSLDFSNSISFSSIGARGSCFEEATPTRFVWIKLSPKQVGGELIDFITVLHDYKAVKTFCSRMQFSLGTDCSVAAGAVGRVLEADLRACDRGSRMCYTSV